MITLNEIIDVLKKEEIELPMTESFSISKTLVEQGFDSMVRADMFITLGEFYDVELMDIDEEKLQTFQEIIDCITRLKK